MERFDPTTETARRIAEVVGARLVAICRWLRTVARAGLVMGLLVVASLAPALLELPGPWDLVAVVALAAVPVWFAWSVHRHLADLAIYTDPDALRAELAGLGDAAGQVQGRVDSLGAPPAGRFGRLRWSFGYLRDVRGIWSDLDLVSRLTRLAEPVNPVRLAATSWKVLALAVTVVVGPLVIVAALLGEAILG